MQNSIRTRLTIAFLGLAVIPLLIVGFILILKTYNVQTKGAIALQRDMAEHLSSRVQSLIGNLENELYILIQIEDLYKLEQERKELILSIFHTHHSAIDELILLNSSEQVLSYHSRLKVHQDLTEQHYKESESFSVPISQGITYFGAVHFNELSGEPLMIISVPIIDLNTGKTKGVLMADIRLKEIWDLVAKIRPGEKGSSFIVDEKNRVIAHSNPSVVLRGTYFNPPDFDGVQTGLNDKKSVVVSQVIKFGPRKFYVVVEGPVSEALSFAISTTRIMLFIIVIALLVAGVLGFLIVRQITKPIEDIAETARAINAGDLSRRVVVKSKDEFGILAKAFNKMTSQLETLINNLESRVNERTIELIETNKDLEAFAYSVSHDLRAPLRHINSFMGLLHENVEKVIDQKSKHYMDIITNSANKMGELIDDLLSFSRMGRIEMLFKDVNLGNIIRDVIEELESETKERNIQWIIEDFPNINGDISMLRVVIMNLISNAVKFTQSRDKTVIEIGCKNKKNEIVVFIRDNGVGFNPEYSNKLFGVFERLHSENEYEGTGVGLATVQRIINRHGGRVWGEGKIDCGATFYFTLPVKKKTA